MSKSSRELQVSSSDKLPHMDTSHYFGGGYNPIHELMRAMVLRAVEDFNSGGELRDLAIQYMTDKEEEYIFSFRFICKYLGMDPDKASHRIMNATHRISTRRRAA